MEIILLSKYRNEIMGMAILWIMFFHLGLPPQLHIFHFISTIGYTGVDMFVLLSGFGIYFSLSKELSLINWYKKRLVRIIPIWLFFTVLLFFCCNPEHYHFFSFQFGELIGRTWWFMPFILSAYIAAPMFYWVVRKGRDILLLTILGILCIMLIYEMINIKNVILDLSLPRYLVFLIGMKLANYCTYMDKIKIKYIVFSLIIPLIFLFVLYNQDLILGGGIDQSYMPYRIYPATLLGFSVSILSAKLCAKIWFINFCFRWFGKNSLELYLTHVLLWWYFMNNNLSDSLVIFSLSFLISP